MSNPIEPLLRLNEDVLPLLAAVPGRPEDDAVPGRFCHRNVGMYSSRGPNERVNSGSLLGVLLSPAALLTIIFDDTRTYAAANTSGEYVR
jgi:hypothetical protein